jgi:hypothetical protein
MRFFFWELHQAGSIWIPYQGTTRKTTLFAGNESYLRWENGKGAIDTLLGARKDGQEAWGKKGVLVSQMRELPVTVYSGYAFDNNTAAIIPANSNGSSPSLRPASESNRKRLSITF